MNANSTILVGRIGKVFWLRVQGRGTFQNSVQVKRAFRAVLDEGLRDLVLDLECCQMMDSTFLGTLTATAAQLFESGTGSFSVVNVSERNLQILSDLGLDQLMNVDVAGIQWPEERRLVCEELRNCEERGADCKKEQTEHVLAAHQTLAEMNLENQSRFRDVIQFLEKELRQVTESDPSSLPHPA
jgi:anti-anti-sigma factor